MAKKQFIRHLEFYGFPDQNKYAGFGDIDLSDIREKNKEQDEEIQDLEGEKAEKKDLDELSGTVENLMAAQAEVNEAFAEAISGMSEDIDELAEEVSALTDTVNDVIDNLEDLSASTNFNIAELRQGFNAYTRYADMEFAHRNNVYTKQEIDDMFASGGTSGYATVEWVEEQGFLTEESGDTLYVRTEDLESISGDIESAITDLTEAIVAVDEKVDKNYDEFSAYTAYAPTIFARKSLEGEVVELKNDVLQNKVDIQKLSADTQALRDDVDEISGKVDTNIADIAQLKQDVLNRVTREEFVDTVNRIDEDIEELDESKADKSDLIIISGRVNTLDAQLTQEITNRVAADAAQNANIANLNVRVTSAETLVREYDERIASAESKVEQEIIDRQEADLDIIGKPTDTKENKTIYGAERYADYIVSGLVESANSYTDDAIRDLDIKFDDLSAKTTSALTEFATKDYVDGRINWVDEKLTNDIKEAQRESSAYTDDEIAKVNLDIDELDSFVRDPSSGVSVTVNKNSTILHALTEWDGEGEYTDQGNGIVDVMHREIHEIDPEAIEEKINTLSGAIDTNTADIATLAQDLASESTIREEKDDELEKADIASAELAEGNKIKLTTKGGDVFEIEIETGGW